MEKIFLSVLNMSLTASFVIAAIMLTRLLLKKAPKIISYALWAVAGFRLVCPFTLESMFSLLPFKAAPLPPDITMQDAPRIDSGIAVIDNAISAVLPAAAPTASVNPLQIWLAVGSFIWILGIAVMLIYSFVSIIILKHRLCWAEHVEDNLYEADNLKTPFVIGLFKPKIYIPAGLSDEERRYIVLHEQTHIRRFDHIVKIFAYLVLCLHWFNPLVWAAFILMGADMEMSCDERVMKELGSDIKNAYSLSLVRVAAGHKILNGSPLAFGEGSMKERIKNVLKFKKPSRLILIASIGLAAVITVGLTVNRITDVDTLDVAESQIIATTYSPDGRYLIEGYDAFYDYASEEYPAMYLRIVEVESGITVWSMDGTFHLQYSFYTESVPPFVWSSDSRYVYIAYVGRIWMHGLVIDTMDMSEQPLPGVMLLAPLFPDTTPEEYRPDAYIVPEMWLDNHTLLVSFSWRVIEDVNDEDNRIYGAYEYNADTNEFTLIENSGGHNTKSNGTTPSDVNSTAVSQRVEDGLRTIMSSPLTSSNPQDYIDAHRDEYENLTLKYPDGVLDYLLSQFEAENADGLRGHIMMLLCKEMLGVQNNVTDESLSPQEWYSQLSIISEIKLPDFIPENPDDEYGGLIYSAIVQHYAKSDDGFMVAAPTVYGIYEEEDKLKIFMTVNYEYYKLYDKTLESTGGAVIPGAIVFRKGNDGWVYEEYLEVGSESLPDGAYFNDSLRKLCVMPVSEKEIQDLAEKMNTDYTNDIRQELLMDNLIEHLTAYGQTGISFIKPDGSIIDLTY